MGQIEYIYGMQRVYSGLSGSIFTKPVEDIALSNRVYLYILERIFTGVTEYIR